MFDTPPLPESAEPAPAELAEPDPYDGIALGVECAWPTAHSIP
jgi:hypothetical protein